jgi:predicted PurR-regulated permease PerM
MKLNFLTRTADQPDSVVRATAVAATIAAFIIVGLLWWKLSDLLPTVFATILIAIAWRGAAQPLAARFRLSPGLSLLAVALGLVVTLTVTLSAFGGQLLRQYDEVAIDAPAAIAMVTRLVEEHPWGRFVEGLVINADFSKAAAPVAQKIGAALGSFGNGLVYCIFAIIGAAYIAADPKGHIDGVLTLTPEPRRERMARFLDRSGDALRRWLLLQLYVVAMNTLFASTALWILDVPAPLALGTISGALAFIPYFGSMIALVVGALVALPHGVESAALAALAIAGASFVEGYLITPYLQSRSLSVPAVVLLFCMLAFGSLFGAMGVVLAVPATVLLHVAYDVFLADARAA